MANGDASCPFPPSTLDGVPTMLIQTAIEGASLFSGLPREDGATFRALVAFAAANRSAVLAGLPWITAEIAGNEGFETMFHVVRTRGGQRLYVSPDLARFALTLGVPVGAVTHRRVIASAGASSVVDMPSAWGVFLALRRVGIDLALSEGTPRAAVAQAFGVTTRSLRKPGPPR